MYDHFYHVIKALYINTLVAVQFNGKLVFDSGVWQDDDLLPMLFNLF